MGLTYSLGQAWGQAGLTVLEFLQNLCILVAWVLPLHPAHCLCICHWRCMCAAPPPAGGDLALVNLPGYGVDAFLTLRRLDTAGWREQLDTDEAATGSAVAVGAALNMQQQLQRNRVTN